MSAKGKTVFVAILASLLALTSCSEDEQVRVNDEETRASAAPRVGAEWTIDQTAGESTADEPAAEPEGGAIARAGDNAVGRAGDVAAARAGDVEARANGSDEIVTNGGGGSAHEITLGVGGDHGTRFSGVCSVGGQEKVIGGVSRSATFTTRPTTNLSARSASRAVVSSRLSWSPGAACTPCNGPTPRKAQ